MESPWDVSEREPDVTGRVSTRRWLYKEVWEGVRPVILHGLQGIIIVFVLVFTDLVYAFYVIAGGWVLYKISKYTSLGEETDQILHIIHRGSIIVASLTFVIFFIRDIW